MNREEILELAYDRAFHYEKENRGCAQSVLAALQDAFNMPDDRVFRAASALSGGCGLTTQGTCGALSGGVMAIGMLFGRERDNFRDPEKKRMIAYDMARKLAKRFEEGYSSVICRDIQKSYLGRSYNLWSKDDYIYFDRVAYQRNMCPHLVGTAAVWTAEIILNQLESKDHQGFDRE